MRASAGGLVLCGARRRGLRRRRSAAAGHASAASAWESLSPATLARTEVAAARVGRFVYVDGRLRAADRRRRRLRRSATTSSGTAGRAWRTCRSGSTTPPPRPTGATSTWSAATARARASTRRPRPSTATTRDADRWSRLKSAPTARGALAVGVIGHRLYAAGGANARDGALATLEIYDFRRRRWRRGPDMRVAREHLAGAVAGGRFYALAGRAAGGQLHRRRGLRPGAPALAARARDAQAARRHRGGDGPRPDRRRRGRGIGRHDPRGRALRPEHPPLEPARGPADPRHGLGAVSRDGRVYVIEGGDQPGFAFTEHARGARGIARVTTSRLLHDGAVNGAQREKPTTSGRGGELR